MVALYPAQDALVRGELSPRLHARASLELYRAGLAKCENFVTLPHGGARKRGGTYFAGETKNSAKKSRLIPFIFSSEQAYALEVGDLYLRVYAYGARVGTVEVVTPWPEADIWRLQFIQSADVMWIVHPSYLPRTLTRTGHTSWTLAEFVFNDGPYLPINVTGTRLTPASRGSVTPIMSSNTTPSGTASNSAAGSSAWQVFDGEGATFDFFTLNTGTWTYMFPGGTTKVADAYWIQARDINNIAGRSPAQWKFEGYDGTNWIVLDSRTGENGWAGGERRYFEFLNEVAYEGYRLVVAATDSLDNNLTIAELAIHEKATTQTPFNLTASGTAGINDGAGFVAGDVGRSIRLLGSDNEWRWARIIAYTSSTVVTIQLYGHALPDTNPITNWRMSAFPSGEYVDSVALFEERLAFSKRFSVYASKTGKFDDFATGEADDDALEFVNAGGGQANDIVWLADADGFLLVATTGGIRALSGSGIDEALTPSSFKNRRSRTFGCAKSRPVDAGSSFLYITNSRMMIAELTQNAQGRFTSDDIGQISEHIPKKGVVELAFQTDPDPLLWFPLDNGELGGFTHQPSQEVRGMHRHRLGGVFSSTSWGVVESACVTPGQDGVDDVWLLVKRTINGSTRRYIEVMQAPFEYDAIEDAFQVDCGLTYTGSATGTLSGLSHLEGQTVDVLATLAGATRVYRGLTVSGGSVTLPGGATTTKAHVGLPESSEAETLELDIGGRDGSRLGRRKKVKEVILSLLETDVSGLEVQSLVRGEWEAVSIPSTTAPGANKTLFTGNVSVRIDDSWEGQGRIRLRHVNPTPCTIRAIVPVFDGEP